MKTNGRFIPISLKNLEVKTSSMGRFFDTVSFVFLGHEKPIFEESAMWLEKFRRLLRNNIKIIDYLEENLKIFLQKICFQGF